MLFAAPHVAFAAEGEVSTPPNKVSSSSRARNFSLLDFDGKHYELRRTDAKVVVLYFAGLNCPIARQSFAKVQRLQDEYRERGVAIWVVDAMPGSGITEQQVDMVAQLATTGLLARMVPRTEPDAEDTIRRLNAADKLRHVATPRMVLGDRNEFKKQILRARIGTLPLLQDPHQVVTYSFGVERTCEAIAIDANTSEIFFRGALDDQMTPGNQKPAPTENYLKDALEEYLAGKPVTKASTPVHGCLISFEKELDADAVSYAKEVAPILEKRCVGCHSEGNIGPFALSSYEDVKTWSAMIQEVILDRRMPPWDADPKYGKFKNDCALTGPEMRTLVCWLKEKCPRGEGEDPLAMVRPATKKWLLGEPDYVVPLPERQEIPATGVLDYRYLNSTFAMPEDAWIRAAVCRPGNPKVLHHMIIRVIYPSGYKDIPSEAYLFTTWAPGMPQVEFPAGTGVFLPKGARFSFEMHYTTNGQVETDQSEIGLYVSKEPPASRLEVRVCETRDLTIPPGEREAKHTAYYCFPRDAIIYDIGPHMHLRGSKFQFQLLYPDGKRETLLSVPRYDFNWQTGHQLVEPKRVPGGTWMICSGAFDNSAKNSRNPNPKKWAKWGLQTTDEMFMGFFTVADVPTGDATAAAK
jgi:hypothetical protein